MDRENAVWVLGARRTPIGRFLGALSGLSAPALGARAVAAALAEAPLPAHAVEELLMGHVLGAGQGQAPARQAARLAGLGDGCRAVGINKVCGSGMQAVILGAERILAGSRQLLVAGGMESMSQAPYLLPRMRQGARIGHSQALDHLYLDGLEDADSGQLMLHFAEETAAGTGIGRAQLDRWALASLERAQAAQSAGAFADELTPIALDSGVLDFDELPRYARAERIARLEPLQVPNGRITAANASAISDGAAALLLADAAWAKAQGLRPLARICGWADHAAAPGDFCTAPINAIETLCQRLGWSRAEVDLFEINEAFALVPLLAQQALNLPLDQINVRGGACALGHPIGASGARILVTLIHALRQRGGGRGVAAICIGGGEATAVALDVDQQ